MRRRCAGRIRVPLPPVEAFWLFTPRGEREWAQGWDPLFPVPCPDDAEPGTVFVTDAHGQRTTWVVTDRQSPTRISYASVRPERAGTVTVTVNSRDEQSEVEVVYDLTSLTTAANAELERFADGYVAFLQSWEHHIVAALRDARPDAGTSAGHTQ